MVTRSEVVAAARSLLATPYHSHARLPGVGIDCVGVPIWVSKATGLKPADFDIGGYSMQPDGSLLPQCDAQMERVPEAEMQPGDMVVCRWGIEPHHVGIVGDWRHGGLSIIHAENYRHKKVIEHRLWFGGAMQFVRAYGFPGIE